MSPIASCMVALSRITRVIRNRAGGFRTSMALIFPLKWVFVINLLSFLRGGENVSGIRRERRKCAGC